jgi:dihydrofolate reductase
MRKLVLKMSMSLDGFVVGSRPDSDWMFRGASPDSGAWVLDVLAGAGTHALGRGLFENWIRFWPTSESPMAEPVNDIEKVVFTRTPGYDPGAQNPAAGGNWAGTRVASGDLVDEIDRLKQEPGEYVLAQGGLAFGRSLVRAGVVDEYRFAVLPVALGRGEGLFTDLEHELDLDLVSSTVFSGGAMGNVFRPRKA